jgi:hypothetical protein
MSGSISSKTRRELGFFLARRREHEIGEIVATVVYKATAADTFKPEEYGRSLNPPSDRHGHPASPYADFQVRAYLEPEGRCFDTRYVFKPVEVDTIRAEACLRVLRSVDRATKAMQDADGYLPGNDFTGHLLRVARAIGADYFDWRPQPRSRIERTDAEGLGEVVSALLGAPGGDS